LAKIAAAAAFAEALAPKVEQALARRAEHGGPGSADVRLLARGRGWTVEDIVCCSGPDDRPFEEQHSRVAIAIVTAGTFQYRGSGTAAGREMMTPGSLLLGNPGQYFECGHEHAAGDRCLSFRFTPEYFESITADVRGRHTRGFGMLRLPPLRPLSSLIARAQATLAGLDDCSWEEVGVRLAAQAIELGGDRGPSQAAVSSAALARVTRVVRMIEHEPDEELTLTALARAARLSPFHFLRSFEDLTGVTPHQYLMRTRLRQAAMRVALETTKILDIALASGFGDVSNFNRAFRAEFGMSPRDYRRQRRLRG
jgi:AraC family transcriptional regulator